MGGFNRQDVLAYIESRARTHTEELNELGRRLDISQKELSEARESLARADESLNELKEASDTRKDETERLNADLERLRSENAGLKADAASSEETAAAVRAERDQLAKKYGDMRAQLEEIEQSKIRVANIELAAYGRAKKIEDSAIENANMAKSALTNLFQDAKKRFDLTKDDATRTVFRISQELDRLKEVLKHLPASFDAISSEIDALKFGSDKKNGSPAEEHEKESFSEAESIDGMQYETIVYPDASSPEAEPIFEIVSDTDVISAEFVPDVSGDAEGDGSSPESDESAKDTAEEW
jgi:chromosome segregation ATPase